MPFDFCSEGTVLPLQREAIKHHQGVTMAEDGTIRRTSLCPGKRDFLLYSHISRCMCGT